MANDAKLMKYIAFRKRLQRDLKLIFHKDKRLNWDDLNYSSEALNDYTNFIFSAYKIDEHNGTEAPDEINLVAYILECLGHEHNDDEFFHKVDNFILDHEIINLKPVERSKKHFSFKNNHDY